MSDTALDSDRVSQEVSSLSTRLIQAMETQMNMENEIRGLRKALDASKLEIEHLRPIAARAEESEKESAEMAQKLQEEAAKRAEAESEAKKLSAEVEELSASVFDEANNMVSNANREKHDFKVRNEKLVATLTERDELIAVLRSELSSLKEVIRDLEDSKRKSMVDGSPYASTAEINGSSVSLGSNKRASVSETLDIQPFTSASLEVYNNAAIYSPTYNFLRLDLTEYKEFCDMVRFLNEKIIKTYEYATMKELSFFKRLLAEDVDGTLRLDTAPDVRYFHRKSVLAALVEGRVVIEPISGVNELWRPGHKKADEEADEATTETVPTSELKENLFSYPKDSPPVATLLNCAFCGEDRNEKLDHARMYSLKIYSKKTQKEAVTEFSHTYSLCSCCLMRVRRTCELFALLRNINNAYRTKIYDFSTSLGYMKAWFALSKIRARMFWARVGIWEDDKAASAMEAVSSPGTPAMAKTWAPSPNLSRQATEKSELDTYATIKEDNELDMEEAEKVVEEDTSGDMNDFLDDYKAEAETAEAEAAKESTESMSVDSVAAEETMEPVEEPEEPEQPAEPPMEPVEELPSREPVEPAEPTETEDNQQATDTSVKAEDPKTAEPEDDSGESVFNDANEHFE